MSKKYSFSVGTLINDIVNICRKKIIRKIMSKAIGYDLFFSKNRKNLNKDNKFFFE
jgi:hypothetical protein